MQSVSDYVESKQREYGKPKFIIRRKREMPREIWNDIMGKILEKKEKNWSEVSVQAKIKNSQIHFYLMNKLFSFYNT